MDKTSLNCIPPGAHPIPAISIVAQSGNNLINKQPSIKTIETIEAYKSMFAEAKQEIKDMQIEIDRIKESGKPLSVACARAAGFEVISKAGKPEHGTILYFGQMHKVDWLPEQVQYQAQTIMSQKTIFDALLTHEPKHVFIEGRNKTFSASAEVRQIYTSIFQNYHAGDAMTESQLTLIDKYQGALMYACLHQDVTLHATTTTAAQERSGAYIQNRIKTSDASFTAEDIKILFGEREQLAMACIQKFHETYPGMVAALIFGADHKGDDFLMYGSQPDYSPQFFFKSCAGQET
jgi:hypothetical protein